LIKYGLAMVILVLGLIVPGMAWADELPPGDEIVITGEPGLPMVTEETVIIEPLAPKAGLVPGIPVPLTNEGSITDEPMVIELPELPPPALTPVNPEILLAEFTTPLINSPANRNHNINQALATLNGQIIKPGSSWSFNQAVGPRTAQRGYKKAMIIVNKKFVPGLGGGICQVASTLYNVITLAKLKVVERHPHSLPVKYVAPGLDAAISYGNQDLKFINSSLQEVIIKTEPQAGKVSIAFYARPVEVAVTLPE